MGSKIYLTIAITSILVFALIATIPITSVSAIAHEGLMGEHQGGNMSQSQHQSESISMLERGVVAMGFNQNKISHQFKSTPTGGEILITALNNSDIETINQIKNHISIIQKEFSAGNFTKPFYIHAQDVPGTKIMGEKKDFIKYSINKIENGVTLTLETKDKELLDAIQQFMTFQGTEHLGH